MTEKYVAPTNGHEIRVNGSGGMNITYPGMSHVTGHGPTDIAAGRVQSLREFFRDERDQELGRWRDPAYPDYVANPLEQDEVRVTHEPTGTSSDLTRKQLQGAVYGGVQEWHRCARAYFDAHPEKKPWHDAKPGEVWVLTVDGKEGAFKLHGGLFRTGNLYDIEQTDRHITAGRRIWPEN